MPNFGPNFFLLLIEIFSAIFCRTKTQNFFVFNWKFVIVSSFFSVRYGLFGVNDNFLLAVNGNDFSITIRLKQRKKSVKSNVSMIKFLKKFWRILWGVAILRTLIMWNFPATRIFREIEFGRFFKRS